MRLQKYMAKSGVASRRKSEEIISAGRVKVNGIVVKEMGYIVKENDKVEVDGKKVALEEKLVYYIINKPVGYITSNDDQFDRKTVLDLLKASVSERVYPVGRLDFNSSGLLIMTNDGDLTNKILHPRYEHEKTYIVKVKGSLTENELVNFTSGVDIGGYTTQPCKLEKISIKNDSTVYSVTIKEGKNRQIRKMFDALNHPVITLKRVSIGPIKLGDLKDGQFRELTEGELSKLRKYLK
jgi:23S rRNA pseudouridine2605 synthase